MRHSTTGALLAALMLGCGDARPGGSQTWLSQEGTCGSEGPELDHRVLHSGAVSLPADAATQPGLWYLLASEEDWDEFFVQGRLYGPGGTRLDPPAVDFETEEVVVLFMINPGCGEAPVRDHSVHQVDGQAHVQATFERHSCQTTCDGLYETALVVALPRLETEPAVCHQVRTTRC